jgi:hypothetical protein
MGIPAILAIMRRKKSHRWRTRWLSRRSQTHNRALRYRSASFPLRASPAPISICASSLSTGHVRQAAAPPLRLVAAALTQINAAFETMRDESEILDNSDFA